MRVSACIVYVTVTCLLSCREMATQIFHAVSSLLCVSPLMLLLD